MKRRELGSLAVLMAVGIPVYALVVSATCLLRLMGWPKLVPVLQARLGIKRRILYLEPFYPESSGYVYRIENWSHALRGAGFTTRVCRPLTRRTSERLLGGHWIGLFFTAYLLRRLGQCLRAPLYNVVVVRRELLLFNDYGNLFMERFLLALNPLVVLDFDDDISAAKREPRPIGPIGRVLLENPTKFSDCLRLYPRFIAGSAYLSQLVHGHRGDVSPESLVIIPTCVSYGQQPTKRYATHSEKVTFGWIGTNGNLPELEHILPELEEVARETPVRLLVISGADMAAPPSFLIENRRWSLDTEIADLLEIDVGLMPLSDTPRTRGKCGFKLIQYMGLGIVSVASAITTNCEIVNDGVDGFLVAPGTPWAPALKRVLDQRNRFAQIGRAALARIDQAYSVDAHAERYVDFMRSSIAAALDGRL